MDVTAACSRKPGVLYVVMPEHRTVAGIVLAAGMSTRLGRPKQLLDFSGAPLVVHVVDRATSGGLAPVVVVTGHAGADVEEALRLRDVTIAHNSAYADGQGSSLVVGVRSLPPSVDAVVILLSDQPTIDPRVIADLIDARRQGASLAIARYGSTPSHPVLFGRKHFVELEKVSGDEGARSVIRRHLRDLVLVDGRSPEPPPDVDNEQAYAELLRLGDAP